MAPDPEAVQARMIDAAVAFARNVLETRTIDPRKLPFLLAQRLREIRGVAEVVGLDETCDVEALYEPARRFCAEIYARPQDRFQGFDYGEGGARNFYALLVKVWSQVRKTESALTTAVLEAGLRPVKLVPRLVERGGETLLAVVSIAYHLQAFADAKHAAGAEGRAIQLPVVQLSRELGVHRDTIAAHINLACRHGLLLVARDGKWSFAERRARDFEFCLDSNLYEPPDGEDAAVPARKPPSTNGGRRA